MASVKSAVRWACKEDYNYTCQFCYQVLHPNQLQIHHILRRRDGGNNHYTNLIPLCGPEANNCHCIVHRYNYTHNSKGERIMFLIHRVII
jgi:5-methylcytosine-specific restriction endonuclease McrA